MSDATPNISGSAKMAESSDNSIRSAPNSALISEATAKQFDRKFAKVFRKFALMFIHNPKLSSLYDMRKTMKRADMANILIEMDNLHLFENVETYGVFAEFITDIGLSLFKGDFSFGFDFQYKLDEEKQRECYDIVLEFAEVNEYLTEPFISAHVLKGWEELLERETKKAYRNGSKKMETNYKNTESGEAYLTELINRVKTCLGPKFAVGIYNGTLTLMDGADRIQAAFERNPMEVGNDEDGAQVLEALFADEGVTEKIGEYGGEALLSLIDSAPGVSGKEKKLIKKRLKTKSGKRQIESTLVSKLGPNAISGLGLETAQSSSTSSAPSSRGKLRTFEHIYMSIMFQGILSKLPEQVRTQTMAQIRRSSKSFISRLASDSNVLGGKQQIKRAQELVETSYVNATRRFESEANVPLNSIKNIRRREMSIYLSCLGYKKRQIDPILSAAFSSTSPFSSRDQHPSKRRRNTKKRRGNKGNGPRGNTSTKTVKNGRRRRK